MTKTNWLLVSVALVLAGVYVFYFTDWFTPKIIHITSHNARTSRTALRARNSAVEPATVPILFKLRRPYKLTDLKIVALDEWQTNHDCLPLWHLVADKNSTNSFTVDGTFTYGQTLRGMKPMLQGAFAQPLQPGVKYRLFLTDGKAKGELDFQPVAKPGSQ